MNDFCKREQIQTMNNLFHNPAFFGLNLIVFIKNNLFLCSINILCCMSH